LALNEAEASRLRNRYEAQTAVVPELRWLDESAIATEEPEADHEDEAELHVAADPGGTAVLEFTPTETGDFVFYCTVEGHRESGMEGTITVVEE
ncbi:MAG: multicopper oxidase domain-containing protein, partial [Dehalococcoidia bacterium]|nr:multicopper oxidase domain-containing protein [Dehalococcoidia bacterium]